MNLLNTESVEIIMEIVQLKKKLVKTVIPEKTMNHLDVIGKELKAMVLESMCDQVTDPDESPSKVKKVEIG